MTRRTAARLEVGVVVTVSILFWLLALAQLNEAVAALDPEERELLRERSTP